MRRPKRQDNRSARAGRCLAISGHSRRGGGSRIRARANELLEPLPDLLLKREELRSLEWRHERRKLLLFLRLHVQTLTLEIAKLVQGGRNRILVRQAVGEDLSPKRNPLGSLLLRQVTPTQVVPLTCALELKHLRIGESNPILGDLPKPEAKLLLELLAAHRGLLAKPPIILPFDRARQQRYSQRADQEMP
jgi:hypothetical protein